jgi:hypothetical protein
VPPVWFRLSRRYDAYAEISGRLRKGARIVHESVQQT